MFDCLDIETVIGFDWDDGNIYKNEKKYSTTEASIKPDGFMQFRLEIRFPGAQKYQYFCIPDCHLSFGKHRKHLCAVLLRNPFIQPKILQTKPGHTSLR